MPNRPVTPTIDSSKMPIKGLHEHIRPKNSVDEFLGYGPQGPIIRMLMIAGQSFAAAVSTSKHAARSDLKFPQWADDWKNPAIARRTATRVADRVIGPPAYCRITQTGSKETSRMVLSDVCLTSASQACTI